MAGRTCWNRSWPAIGAFKRRYFRADAAFASPEVNEFLEAEYAIRLPANQILRGRIAYLLTRPVGRPPTRSDDITPASAIRRKAARRVVAKVEWHPGDLYPRVGLIVTNMTRPAEEGATMRQASKRVPDSAEKIDVGVISILNSASRLTYAIVSATWLMAQRTR